MGRRLGRRGEEGGREGGRERERERNISMLYLWQRHIKVKVYIHKYIIHV